MIKKILKYISTFIILLLIFNLLLFAGSLYPSKIIEKNVKKSSQILTEEGNLYEFFEWSDVVNNNYTDALMINEAYSIDNTNPLYSYMAVRKNFNKEITKKHLVDTQEELISINSEDYDPVGELEQFVNGNIDTSINYARYWHGYLPILRTLLIFLDIAGIRKILLIIFIILFIWLIKLIKEKIGITASMIFAISLILEGYFYVSYSLESAPVFIVMMISSIILLKRIDKIKNLYLYIFIISCITNFVDYLTVPLITLAIPLLLYILYKQKNDKEIKCKDYIKIIIKSSIIWFIGYATTWISKWIIYDIIYQEGLLKSAIMQVMYRSESYNKYKIITIQEMVRELIFDNIGYTVMIFNIFIFGCFICKKKYKLKIKEKSEYFNESIPMLLISIMPLVWYRALANHTLMHYRFVYRHMLIFLIGITICLKNIFTIEKTNENK